MRTRVIPVLLLHQGGLVKSVKFRSYRYVGDPMNAVRIFNEKEADELVLIDIDATREGRGPRIAEIATIVSEAFMPVSYGGGISSLEQVHELVFNGVEKVIINKAAVRSPELISAIAQRYGAQAVVASMDAKRSVLGGIRVFTDNGTEALRVPVVQYAQRMEAAGAGEILLQSVDRDGTYRGYDLDLVREVTAAVRIPVIAAGGASSPEDFVRARQAGASAVSAGSMFVFQRPHNAVLISYPSQTQLKKLGLV